MMRVIKVGGRAQSDPSLVPQVQRSWNNGSHGQIVLVHGGGDEVSTLQSALGGSTQFVNGRRVTTAGAVIVRQRPGTAKGFVFLTLEDETGLSQAIVSPTLFSEQRSTILSHSGLIVEGVLQNTDGQCSVKAEKFWPLPGVDDIQSHDFH